MSLKKVILSLAMVLLLSYIASLIMGVSIEGIHEYSYYTQLERVEGNWYGLIHWRVKAQPLAWLHVPELLELHMVTYPPHTFRGIDKTSDLQQAESITVYALIRHDVSLTRARSGFFTWGRAETTQGNLVIMADDGTGYYVANEQVPVYSLPLPGTELPLEEQARLRKKSLIPAGVHPSILWVLLAYFGIVGILLMERWRSQDFTVAERSKEKILEGPVFKGNWPNIKENKVKLPKYKYTSPVLAKLLSGEEFRHGVQITTYIVVQSRVQEARTGPLVWARARDTRVELMLVVESGLQRFTPAEQPVVFQERDREFDDSPALFERAAQNKKWLLPRGFGWR